VYKGCKKWGELQQCKSRSLNPIELIKEDKLGLLGAQRVAELYGRGKKYCKFIYERYPATGTRFVLSNKDNLANEVIDNFYTGKKSKLTFNENHHLSKELAVNPTFQTYWHDYLNVLAKLITSKYGYTIIEAITDENFKSLFSLAKWLPNFSVKSEIISYDYYGLIGNTQQIEVELEIFKMNTYQYLVNTKMYIRDTYGADRDDINDVVSIKTLSQSLPAFYVLQNCFGCHPFVTEIIYNHSYIIDVTKL
jgi:hypothetical protein